MDSYLLIDKIRLAYRHSYEYGNIANIREIKVMQHGWYQLEC